MSDDLSAFDTKASANEGKPLFILKPDLSGWFLDDEGKPWSIDLKGSDSDEFRRAREEMRRAIWKSSVDNGPLSQEALDGFNADLMAACTVSWSGINLEGKVLPCTLENAKMLYRKFPWLLDRVSQFVEGRENFTKPRQSLSSGDDSAKASTSDGEGKPSKGKAKA